MYPLGWLRRAGVHLCETERAASDDLLTAARPEGELVERPSRSVWSFGPSIVVLRRAMLQPIKRSKPSPDRAFLSS